MLVASLFGLVASGSALLLRRSWPGVGVGMRGIVAVVLLGASLSASGPAAADDSIPEQARWTPIAATSAAGFAPRPLPPAAAFAPLFRPGLDLRAPPVELPLQLRIPSIDVTAPILGVGITPSGVMDAPMGSRDDPVWQQAFWYRGGGIPGDAGTATIAGHVSGGRAPSLFAHLRDLQRGDEIVVHDARTGLDIRFVVTAMKTYSLKQLAATSVLTRIYGAGPVSGRGPLAASDGVSSLTLVTCAGDYDGTSYDRRLVVYAERTNRSSGEEPHGRIPN